MYPWIMKTQVVLSTFEPLKLQEEFAFWCALSMQGLARAYSDDEPEYFEEDLEPQTKSPKHTKASG